MFVDLGVRNFNASSLTFSDDQIIEFKNKSKRYFDIRNLEEYLLGRDNYLNVEKITEDFFPKVEADVFLSHSHHDENDVIKLALCLENKGLDVFVDSCVWGWADKLLKKIDNEYCLKDDGLYSYENRNRTTSNVYMILNSALQSTISQCELFLFLHTDNSIKMTSIYSRDQHIASPWIFSELSFAKLCQRSSRKRYGVTQESLSGIEKRACDSTDVLFAYPNPGTRYNIDNNEFHEWLATPPSYEDKHDKIKALESLDRLYTKIKIPHILLKESRDINN